LRCVYKAWCWFCFIESPLACFSLPPSTTNNKPTNNTPRPTTPSPHTQKPARRPAPAHLRRHRPPHALQRRLGV
jgi:hypothetical protein